MPKDTLLTFAPSDYAVYTSVLGTAMPVVLPTSGGLASSPGAGWFDCGLLSDAGMSEAHNYNENKIYDMAGSLVRIVRNQEERPWTFECLQYDAVVAGLKYPGTTVSTSGASAEIQQIAISGVPTGGTFTPHLAGFPDPAPQAFNVSTAALQTALQNAWDLNVTVAGTAGTTYNVTFPAGEGNVTQMTVTSALTGGTTPTATVSTTTPGVTGVNSRAVGAGIARNLRQFCFDLLDGATAIRVLVALGEAEWTGTVTYAGSAAKIDQFTMQPFKDGNGNYYTILDNAQGQGLTFV